MSSTPERPLLAGQPASADVALPWLMLGLVAGVSLFAQPLKFLTPGLSTAQLVAVGSTLFHGSHALQWAGLMALALLVPRKRARPAIAWGALAVATGTLLLQSVWLTPELDARLAVMLSGQSPPASVHHGAYVLIEAIKMAALLRLATLPRRPPAVSATWSAGVAP